MLVSKEIMELVKRENKRYREKLKGFEKQLTEEKAKHDEKISRLYANYKETEEFEAYNGLAVIKVFNEVLPATTLDYFTEREICEAIGFSNYELLIEMNLLQSCGKTGEGLILYTPTWR